MALRPIAFPVTWFWLVDFLLCKVIIVRLYSVTNIYLGYDVVVWEVTKKQLQLRLPHSFQYVMLKVYSIIVRNMKVHWVNIHLTPNVDESVGSAMGHCNTEHAVLYCYSIYCLFLDHHHWKLSAKSVWQKTKVEKMVCAEQFKIPE